MKQHELKELMERARLRTLSPEDEHRLQEFLEADPGVWPDWEEDMALSRVLDAMPDAPLASNFSARVMLAVEQEERSSSTARPRPGLAWWSRHWVARLGLVSSVAIIVAIGWQQHQQQKRERSQIAESVATISEVASVPSVEILRDFDVIQSLDAVPPAETVEADLTLLAALE